MEVQLEIAEAVPAKLADWKNPPKITDLKQDLEDAKPSHDAQINKIKQWRNNLNMEGNAKPKTRKGS